MMPGCGISVPPKARTVFTATPLIRLLTLLTAAMDRAPRQEARCSKCDQISIVLGRLAPQNFQFSTNPEAQSATTSSGQVILPQLNHKISGGPTQKTRFLTRGTSSSHSMPRLPNQVTLKFGKSSRVAPSPNSHALALAQCTMLCPTIQMRMGSGPESRKQAVSIQESRPKSHKPLMSSGLPPSQSQHSICRQTPKRHRPGGPIREV